MNVEAMSAEERAHVLRRRDDARLLHEQAMARVARARPWSDAEAQSLADAERALHEMATAEADYFNRLPRVSMGCCPFDGLPLMRSIDPYGLDGPWWHPDAVSEETPPCPHFCVLDGTLHAHAPSVLPRLLQHASMKAVLAQLTFDELPTIVTVAYFAERRPRPERLTADWPRRSFAYSTQRGTNGWRPADEAHDPDLLPWLRAGKLLWCPPGGDNTTLAKESPDRCPYAARP